MKKVLFVVLVMVFMLALATTAFAARPVHQVSGGGELFVGFAPNEIYGFNAKSDAEGNVEGQYQSAWSSPGFSLTAVESLAAQDNSEELEAFRDRLINLLDDLREVNASMSDTSLTDQSEKIANNQLMIADAQQMILELRPEQLEQLRDALPQNPSWWELPQDLLTVSELMGQSNLASSSSRAALALQAATMRPIEPGVPPVCPAAPSLDALIAAKSAVRAAEIAVRVAEIAMMLTPGDQVFGVIVLGEGTVSTIAPHPARVVTVVIVEIAKVALETAKTVQFGIQTAIDYRSSCLAANHQAVLHDFAAMMRVELQVIEVKTLGCSQGYWKNHTEVWDSAIAGPGDLTPTYDPSTLFDDVFGPDADKAAGLRDGSTLLDTLSAKGNVSQARNAVTLLLNNDALNAGNQLPCDLIPPGDVGKFTPIVGPFMRRFLLSSSEAGEPVDVGIVSVQASSMNPSNLNFTDLTAATTASVVKTGIQSVEIELTFPLRDVRVFEFQVVHDHEKKSIDGMHDIVHLGTILFHQAHEENLGMGQ